MADIVSHPIEKQVSVGTRVLNVHMQGANYVFPLKQGRWPTQLRYPVEKIKLVHVNMTSTRQERVEFRAEIRAELFGVITIVLCPGQAAAFKLSRIVAVANPSMPENFVVELNASLNIHFCNSWR